MFNLWGWFCSSENNNSPESPLFTSWNKARRCSLQGEVSILPTEPMFIYLGLPKLGPTSHFPLTGATKRAVLSQFSKFPFSILWGKYTGPWKALSSLRIPFQFCNNTVTWKNGCIPMNSSCCLSLSFIPPQCVWVTTFLAVCL